MADVFPASPGIPVVVDDNTEGGEQLRSQLRTRAAMLLAGAAIVGGLLAGVADLLLPSWYAAEAKLVVFPIDDPIARNGINPLDGAAALTPVLASLLNSHPVAQDAARRLNLQRLWHLPSQEAAARELARRVAVVSDRKSNLLTVRVEDRNPQRARDVAAAVVAAARDRSDELWSARNRDHRMNLEARLAEVDASLAAAEAALRRFSEEHGVVDLPQQVKASVDQASALQALRINKDLEQRAQTGFVGRRAPETIRARRERRDAESELALVVRGQGSIGRDAPLLPLERLPRLDGEYRRLRRAVDTLGARHELLSRDVEELRAAEVRPSGRAEVIDDPQVPVRRTRPARPVMVAEGAVGGLVLAGLLLYALSRRRLAQQEPEVIDVTTADLLP